MENTFLFFWIAPLSALIALITAFTFYRHTLGYSEGTDRMREIAEAVRVGASAYMRRQYKIVALFFHQGHHVPHCLAGVQ